MSNKPTMTEDDLKRYQARRRKEKGLPDFDNEAEMQMACEKFLRQCGFMPRTQGAIPKHNRFWYIHLHKTKANPILADLVLMDSRRLKYAEIELKNGGTKLSVEQGYLCKRGEIVVCRYMAEFKEAVFKFMEGSEK